MGEDRVALPAPFALAKMLTAPDVTAYHDKAQLVLDGTTYAAADLVPALLAAYRELPDRDDVRAPYDALRRVAVADLAPVARSKVEAHAAQALRCWRDTLAVLPKVKAPASKPKRRAMTAAERKEQQRATTGKDELATADAYLEQLFLAPGTAGAVVLLAKLYAAFLRWADERHGEGFSNDLARESMCHWLDELTEALDSGELTEEDLSREDLRRLDEDDDEVYHEITSAGRKAFDRLAENYGEIRKTKSGKVLRFASEDVAARWRAEMPPLVRT
ncbi:MAG: hypothetical protein M3306_17685 [Actinomycetota bacterium]|nr:hypothetical protein [Actinomycetota bacterium]